MKAARYYAVVAVTSLSLILILTARYHSAALAEEIPGKRIAGHPFDGKDVNITMVSGRQYQGKLTGMAYLGEPDRGWTQYAILYTAQGEPTLLPSQNIELIDIPKIAHGDASPRSNNVNDDFDVRKSGDTAYGYPPSQPSK